jgi:hypothetical protein
MRKEVDLLVEVKPMLPGRFPKAPVQPRWGELFRVLFSRAFYNGRKGVLSKSETYYIF